MVKRLLPLIVAAYPCLNSVGPLLIEHMIQRKQSFRVVVIFASSPRSFLTYVAHLGLFEHGKNTS